MEHGLRSSLITGVHLQIFIPISIWYVFQKWSGAATTQKVHVLEEQVVVMMAHPLCFHDVSLQASVLSSPGTDPGCVFCTVLNSVPSSPGANPGRVFCTGLSSPCSPQLFTLLPCYKPWSCVLHWSLIALRSSTACRKTYGQVVDEFIAATEKLHAKDAQLRAREHQLLALQQQLQGDPASGYAADEGALLWQRDVKFNSTSSSSSEATKPNSRSAGGTSEG
eukprot:scaffold95435_cov17-Tisochrysis_lutea.AAC.1